MKIINNASLKGRLEKASKELEQIYKENNYNKANKFLVKFYNLYLDCQNTRYELFAEYVKLKIMLIIIAHKAGIAKI